LKRLKILEKRFFPRVFGSIGSLVFEEGLMKRSLGKERIGFTLVTQGGLNKCWV